MQYISVRVVNGSGTPCYYEKVTIMRANIVGGTYPAQWTNRDGLAEFEIDISSSDRIIVSVKGRSLYEGCPRAKIAVVV